MWFSQNCKYNTDTFVTILPKDEIFATYAKSTGKTVMYSSNIEYRSNYVYLLKIKMVHQHYGSNDCLPFAEVLVDELCRLNEKGPDIILEFDTELSKIIHFDAKFFRAAIRFNPSLMNRFLIKYDISLARQVKPTDKGLSCKLEKDRPSGAVRLPPAGRPLPLPAPPAQRSTAAPHSAWCLLSQAKIKVLVIHVGYVSCPVSCLRGSFWFSALVGCSEDNVKKHPMKNWYEINLQTLPSFPSGSYSSKQVSF